MKKTLSLLMPMLMLAAGGCARCGNLVLTADDAGKTCVFDASGSREVEIRLAANSTTGFNWEFTVEGDTLAVTGEEYRPDRTGDRQLCGGGGTTVLTLTPVRNGSGKIFASYLRKWEKDQEPAKSVFWEISVTGMPEE